MRTDERVHPFVRALVAALSVLLLHVAPAAAQTVQPGNADLAQRLERRFTVLPISDGVVLTPRSAIAGVRSIELSKGTISIDGAPVTGSELRQKLGDDADAVLQLSYLTPDEQRAIARGSDAGAGAAPVPAPPTTARRGNGRFDDLPPRARGGDIVHIGRDVRVEAGDIVRGNAVSIGRSVTVLGEVRGDAVAIGGDMELGPQASVTGNVVVIGGTLTRDPSARVGGEVQIHGWGNRFGDLFRRSWTDGSAPPFGFAAPLALIAQITRAGVLCLLAVLIVLVAGGVVNRVGERAAAEPLKAGAVGFLAQILFLPLLIVTIILLVVTIIGIPLLVLIPFAVLGLVLVALVGFTAVAHRVGQMLSARLSWTAGPYLQTTAGVILLLIPLLLARLIGLGGFPLSFVSFLLACIGWIVEYIAWTIGFGAVALTRFSRSTAALAPKAS